MKVPGSGVDEDQRPGLAFTSATPVSAPEIHEALSELSWGVAVTDGPAQPVCWTERAVTLGTSCGGKHLEISDLLEGYHRLHQHLTNASQCNGAENLGSDTPASDLYLRCVQR
jgi:hypothetical protein